MRKAIVMYTTAGCGDFSVPTLDVEGTVVPGDRFDPERFEGELRSAGALRP